MKRLLQRLALVALSALLAALPLAHAQVAWKPDRPWPQTSAWIGSRACAGCHADLYRRQETSNHARSLRPSAEIKELKEGLPYSRLDRSSGATLTLHADLHLVAEKGSDRQAIKLEWAFGSGKKGITPVGRRENGAIVESRLSWYASGGFGTTTGAGQRDPQSFYESLGRALTDREAQECFGCHTTGYLPGQPAPARQEMGVRCERCHGPGANHARAMQEDPTRADRQILHPGKLDAASQVQMCGVCHGRPPADSDVAALRRIEQSPNTVRFPSQRLVLSRCYNESAEGLPCSRCHDPHVNVSSRAADLDRACLGCHVKPLRVCPKAAAGCATCHMPKRQVMLHSLFTDHFIRVAERTEERK